MNTEKNAETEGPDKEIAYSRTVKAGKRIYYLDVKRSRNEELYLCLTESKKRFPVIRKTPMSALRNTKYFCIRRIWQNLQTH